MAIRLLSLFSGIGAFEKAMDDIGMDYELVNYCEIDKYASKSYCAIHGVDESKNLWDVKTIDTSKLKDIDLVSYGFPCQDISQSGLQKGLFNEDGSVTRSGLFFEALRIIQDTKPKVSIAENVKNLLSNKFAEQFNIVLTSLAMAGYNNYFKVLNSTDYGIPQNRERVFIVSIRKDIDNFEFKFPYPIPLELKLKDMLENSVDSKYNLDNKFESVSKVSENTYMLNGGSIGKMYESSRRVYSAEYVSPTIDTNGGGNREPKVAISEEFYAKYTDGVPNNKRLKETLETNDAKAYDFIDAYNHSVSSEVMGTMTSMIGAGNNYFVAEPNLDEFYLSQKGVNYVLDSKRGMATDINEDVAQTITAKGQGNWTGSFISPNIEHINRSNVIGSTQPTEITLKNGEKITNKDDLSHLRIRKLTPKECFRLQGFKDSDFEKASQVVSNTQLYRQAGNSITVDVLKYLFNELREAGIL